MAEPKAKAKPKAKQLCYAGIKQVGSKWYSEKDKYLKGFDTADECAKNFN